MPKLPNFLCIRKRRVSTGSMRTVGSVPADVALMKLAVFLKFGADMLGDAPNTPLTNNADVEAVVFEDLAWRFALFVGSHKKFFELFGKRKPGIGNAVDVGILPK